MMSEMPIFKITGREFMPKLWKIIFKMNQFQIKKNISKNKLEKEAKLRTQHSYIVYAKVKEVNLETNLKFVFV